MYTRAQKESSSVSPTSIHKKSNNSESSHSFSVQRQQEINSSPEKERPKYSRDAADLLAANVMRSMAAREPGEEAQGHKGQEESGAASVAQVVMPKPQLPIAPAASVSHPSGQMAIQRQCSACQQGMEFGKDSDEISSSAGVQTKLTVGAVGDKYEQEADRVAAQVMRMSVAPNNSPQVQRFGEEDNPVQRWSLAQSITPVVQRQVDEQVQMRSLVQRAFQAGGNEASGDLESRLNASKGKGSALAPEVRAFMEPRFGADFSGVRVHTGGEAVQMNRELGAMAFTHERDIFFGEGKEPGNNELTAHELTHVVQQNPVISTKRVQQYETQQQNKVNDSLFNSEVQPKYKEGGVKKQPAQIHELSETEVVQRLEVPQNEEERISFRINIQGNQAVINNPEAFLVVTLSQIFQIEPATAQAKIRDEGWKWVDPNFSGPTAEVVESGFFTVNIPLSSYRRTRDSLNEGNVQRGEDGRISGAEERVNNFNQLPEEERARTNAEIDRRFSEKTNRNQQLDPNNPQDQPYIKLWNEIRDEVLLEQGQRSSINALPPRLKDFLFAKDAPQTIAPRDYGTVLRIAEKLSSLSDAELADYKSKVTADTTDWKEFEASIDRYRTERLQRRRNLEEREQLKTKLYGLEELYRKYKEYKSALSNAALSDTINPGSSLGLHLSYIPEIKKELDTALEQQGFSSISEFETLIRNYETAFETETVAIALDLLAKYENILYEQEKNSSASAQSQGEIQEKREDIQKTRANVTDNPELIYKLDELLKVSYQTQGIQPDSIYDLIIQDRIRTVQINEIIKNLAIAVLAVALGLVSGGGGTVGVLAGVAGFGLGAYQVVEEFRQYEIKSAASGSGLLSDDPSFGWVIVAVLGAGLDLAGAVAAIRAMKPAVETFNATGDLAQFRRSLQGLSEVNQKLQANVLRAAEAELQYRQALRNLVSTGGRLRMVIVPGGEEFVKLVEVAYLLAKRGVIAFEQFLLELKAQRLIAELDELAPDEWFRQLPVEQQQTLKQAWLEGSQQAANIDRARLSLNQALNNFQPDENITREAVAQTLEAIFQSGTTAEKVALSKVVDQLLTGANSAAISDFLRRVAGIRNVDGVVNGQFDELYDAFQRGDAILAHGPLQTAEFPAKEHILDGGRYSMVDNPNGNPSRQITKGWNRIIDFVIVYDGGNMRLILGRNHSGLSRGRAYVYGAGELIIDNSGKVLRITRRSGHYQPTIENLRRASNLLIEKGFIGKDVEVVTDGF